MLQNRKNTFWEGQIHPQKNSCQILPGMLMPFGLRIALHFLSSFLCFHDASTQLIGLLQQKSRSDSPWEMG